MNEQRVWHCLACGLDAGASALALSVNRGWRDVSPHQRAQVFEPTGEVFCRRCGDSRSTVVTDAELAELRTARPLRRVARTWMDTDGRWHATVLVDGSGDPPEYARKLISIELERRGHTTPVQVRRVKREPAEVGTETYAAIRVTDDFDEVER